MKNNNDAQIVNIIPPTPHSRKQELIMRGFLFPDVTEIIVVCGTKFGKSIGAATCMTNAMLQKRNAKWRWLAPIFRQATIGMDYFRGILPPAPHTEFLDSKMQIKLPFLQSHLEFMHTQNPKDLEGPGIHGQIADEAAKMPYEAYISARTTTSYTRGPSMWVSTPYGKNWFYKKYLEARDEMEWAIKNEKPVTRLAIHAPTTENPNISPAMIEAARKELPDRLFRQYYLAEFVDEGSVFVGTRDCVDMKMPTIESGPSTHWIIADADDREKGRDVVIAADWAKQSDYCVFIAIDYKVKPRKVVGVMRFHGISYVKAAKELYLFSQRFRSVATAWHDKTGVGEAIDDILAGIPLPFDGKVFSNSFKSTIVNTLGLTLEKREIDLPNWPEMLHEFDSFEVEVSDLGVMKFNAASGFHDDIVIAIAMANCAAMEFSDNSFEVNFLEDLKDKKFTLDHYYKDLMEDDPDTEDRALLGLL